MSGDGGVRVGVQTSSFRDLPAGPDGIEALIRALTDCGATNCELDAASIEPFRAHHSMHHAPKASMTPQMMRRELRKWRLRTPLPYFESIGKRFQRAGVTICSYAYSPDATFADEEIDRGFAMAKALGARILTASTNPEIARRIAPFADKHRMIVALNGLPPLSAFFRLHVDLGQFTANGGDPVAYIREHHTSIMSVRLTDCRKRDGSAVVWGEGDTPIREVLQLLKRENWPVPAYVQYQYRGQGTAIEEVKRCLRYVNEALT